MTYTPATLATLRDYLRPATGLEPNALGIQHWSPDGGGYHEGWDLLVQGYGRGDYSVCESWRDAHPTDGASAIDIGDFSVTAFGRGVSLRAMSLWLVAQCEADTSDTADIREIIYTPDGRNVARWDRLRIRSSGDDSHLYHTHISWFRDAETRDKVGLFRRFFEPPAPPPAPRRHRFRFVEETAMSLPIHMLHHAAHPEVFAAFGTGLMRHIGPAEFAIFSAPVDPADPSKGPKVPLVTMDDEVEYQRCLMYTRALQA